jgi:hypothetical protein
MISFSVPNPAGLGTGVYSASNRNEYQEEKNYVSEKQSAAVAEKWQLYRHLWADCLDNVGSLTPHSPTYFHGLLRDIFSFFFFTFSYC